MTLSLPLVIKACEKSLVTAQAAPVRDQAYLNKVAQLLIEANVLEYADANRKIFSMPLDEVRLIGKTYIEFGGN